MLAIASSPLSTTLEPLRLSMPNGETPTVFEALRGARWPGQISPEQAERLLSADNFPTRRACTIRGAEAVPETRLPPALDR